MEFAVPRTPSGQIEEKFARVSAVRIGVPGNAPTEVLVAAGAATGLALDHGAEPLAQLTFNRGRAGVAEDLRPDLPLVVRW